MNSLANLAELPGGRIYPELEHGVVLLIGREQERTGRVDCDNPGFRPWVGVQPAGISVPSCLTANAATELSPRFEQKT